MSAAPSPNDEPSAPGPAFEQDPIWRCVVSDPTTGVSLVGLDGVILYCNAQAARIFFGQDLPPDKIMGRRFDELFPPEWVAERLRILADMREHRKPVLLRTIWDGFQHVSWIQLLPAEGDCAERALVITRRLSAEDLAQVMREGDYQYVESGVVRLGDLDALTERELEVLALLGQGLSIKEIAGLLRRSPKTIDNQRQSVGRKLGAGDRVKLAEIARRAGLRIGDAARQRV